MATVNYDESKVEIAALTQLELLKPLEFLVRRTFDQLSAHDSNIDPIIAQQSKIELDQYYMNCVISVISTLHNQTGALAKLIALSNSYIDRAAPWAVRKQGDTSRYNTIMGIMVMNLNEVACMLWTYDMQNISSTISAGLVSKDSTDFKSFMALHTQSEITRPDPSLHVDVLTSDELNKKQAVAEKLKTESHESKLRVKIMMSPSIKLLELNSGDKTTELVYEQLFKSPQATIFGLPAAGWKKFWLHNYNKLPFRDVELIDGEITDKPPLLADSKRALVIHGPKHDVCVLDEADILDSFKKGNN